MKYTVIVNLNIEYVLDAKSEKDAKKQMRYVEFPENYVDESFKIVKIIKEDSYV